MAENPFAVPEVPITLLPEGTQALVTADAGQRFVARVVDNLLFAATLIPSAILYGMVGSPDPELDPFTFLAAMIPSGVVCSAFLVWQWYRQSIDGTTVGKRMADIRIVTAQGRPPGFVAGVLVRSWCLTFVQAMLGGAGNVLSLIDALMVFSDKGRTIHDRLAGTRVVRDATPRFRLPAESDDLDPDLA